MAMNHEHPKFQNNICGCFNDCGTCKCFFCLKANMKSLTDTPIGVEAWCCPCMTYGKTQYRLNKGRNASMQDHSCTNGPCALYAVLALFTGFGHCVLQCMQSSQVRRELNIKGNGCSDCSADFWVPACALCQEENEVKEWQEGKGQYAALQPSKQEGMNYVQQQPYGTAQPGYGHAQPGYAPAPTGYAQSQPYAQGQPAYGQQQQYKN